MNRRQLLRVATLALSAVSPFAVARAESFVDRSSNIFFPPAFEKSFNAQRDFGLFRWSFVVLRARRAEDALETAENLCARLVERANDLESLAWPACPQNFKSLEEPLRDWSHDVIYRREPPAAELFRAQLREAAARASLPMDRALLNVVRMDPLSSYLDLQKLLTGDKLKGLQAHGPLYLDPSTGRVAIPLHFDFTANESAKTLRVLNVVNEACQQSKGCAEAHVMGAHASNFENENRIGQDLHAVEWAGYAVLALIGVAILSLGRWRLLLLLPPVFVAMALSVALTVWVFGSIHGLTLAFGTGIVGLALDYGLHAMLTNSRGRTWRSNFLGLATTLTALVVMCFSQVPLLRQIMFFSIAGLGLGYSLFWLLDRYWPSYMVARPFAIVPRQSSPKTLAMAFLVLCGVLGPFVLRPGFGLEKLNYLSAKTRAWAPWLFAHLPARDSLFYVHDRASPSDALRTAWNDAKWAEQEGLRVESLARFMPPIEAQKAFHHGWSALGCELEKNPPSQLESKLFEPFLSKLSCGGSPSFALDARVPAYLKDFESQGRWLSIWFPSSVHEKEKIQGRFPAAISLRELVGQFPREISREMSWMAPVALLLTFLILVFYYRRKVEILCALIPFFAGLGLFTLAHWLFQFELSFISIIALVMVFGFSFDFGIFATDLMNRAGQGLEEGVWSSLVLSALTNVCGFFPLLFCHHPVLVQLGQGLVCGGIGTLVGALWGIPGSFRYLKARGW